MNITNYKFSLSSLAKNIPFELNKQNKIIIVVCSLALLALSILALYLCRRPSVLPISLPVSPLIPSDVKNGDEAVQDPLSQESKEEPIFQPPQQTQFTKKPEKTRTKKDVEWELSKAQETLDSSGDQKKMQEACDMIPFLLEELNKFNPSQETVRRPDLLFKPNFGMARSVRTQAVIAEELSAEQRRYDTLENMDALEKSSNKISLLEKELRSFGGQGRTSFTPVPPSFFQPPKPPENPAIDLKLKQQLTGLYQELSEESLMLKVLSETAAPKDQSDVKAQEKVVAALKEKISSLEKQQPGKTIDPLAGGVKPPAPKPQVEQQPAPPPFVLELPKPAQPYLKPAEPEEPVFQPPKPAVLLPPKPPQPFQQPQLTMQMRADLAAQINELQAEIKSEEEMLTIFKETVGADNKTDIEEKQQIIVALKEQLMPLEEQWKEYFAAPGQQPQQPKQPFALQQTITKIQQATQGFWQPPGPNALNAALLALPAHAPPTAGMPDTFNAALEQVPGNIKQLNLERLALNDAQIAALPPASQVKKAEAQQLVQPDPGPAPVPAPKLTDFERIQKQLGPVAPRYIPEAGYQLLTGAKNLEDIRDDLSSEQIAAYEAYNERYGECEVAAMVVKDGFSHALAQLLEEAEQTNAMLQLNKSDQTPGTPGGYAVCYQMVYDILSCAALSGNGCDGFQVDINSNVHMLPSNPEMVMKQQGPNMPPQVAVQFGRRDDFTPDPKQLPWQTGVNAPALLTILRQLSSQEIKHFRFLFLSALILDDNPEYQETMQFMSNRDDPRVQLIETAYEFLKEIGDAIQIKYGQSIMMKCWQKVDLDCDIEPFIKAEKPAAASSTTLELVEDDDILDIPNSDVVEVKVEEKSRFVPWELDEAVLGDELYGELQQPEFVEFVKSAKRRLETMEKLLKETQGSVLQSPEAAGEVNLSTWQPIKQQYHISHTMLASGMQQHYCLFSNVLAAVVGKKDDLTGINVMRLKRAMGHYLNHLIEIANLWKFDVDGKKLVPTLSKQEQEALISSFSSETKKTYDLVQLKIELENKIRGEHNLSLGEYQNWLDGSARNHTLDAGSMSPLELEIAAYTLGVRIVLIRVGSTPRFYSQEEKQMPFRERIKLKKTVDSMGVADSYGRITSQGEAYGPETEVRIYMATIQSSSGGGSSFYGLFPKCKKLDSSHSLDADAIKELDDYQAYWASIQTRDIY